MPFYDDEDDNPLSDPFDADDAGEGCDDPHYASLDNDRLADDESDDDEDDDFADPGGKSALRAATPSNPRNLPCPTCKQPNRLTPRDRRLGYQCNECADRDEGVGY